MLIKLLLLGKKNILYDFFKNSFDFRCDQAAINGVVHSVDSFILPRNMGQKRKRSFWVF